MESFPIQERASIFLLAVLRDGLSFGFVVVKKKERKKKKKKELKEKQRRLLT